MKKIIFLSGLVLMILFIASCSDSNQNGNNGNGNGEELKVEDYFPIRENMKYVYEGAGNEFASYEVNVDYTNEKTIQRRINNGGTEVAEVIEVRNGKVTRLFSLAEVYYRENFLEKRNMSEVLLMEPLEEGTSWELENSLRRTITNISAQVTTPSGTYTAIEVTTENLNIKDEKITSYYARDVGLVKSVFLMGDNEEDQITSSLREIQEDAVFKQPVSFFYPNINDDRIYFKVKTIEFKTNDVTRNILENAYKEEIPSNVGKVFSDNTKINSLYLNDDGMVYLDLSPEYLTEMSAGAGYESMMLQCLANTFGKYYGSDVSKVLLTIDSQPYSSGHIYLEEGEYLNVKLEDTIEIN